MLLVGLTGGIGSGKSTVAEMLAARGAVVFDADAFARRAIGAGTPGAQAVVERFGPEMLREDGSIDRPKLGNLEEAIDPYRATDAVVVYDTPLLVETGLHRGCDVVVVVSTPEETQVARVTASRDLSATEVRTRIAAQSPPELRAGVADVILDNEGTIEELEGQVDRLWAELRERAQARPKG
jgi:dephospho-CoA kinase